MFEQPPCPDGHGPDCPERACVECGTAVLLGGLIDLGGPGSAGPSEPSDPAADPARGTSLARPSARRTAGASGGASTRAVA